MQNMQFRGERWIRALLMAGAALVLSGCASVYVDGATPEVPVAQYKKPEPPKPVQLLFQFQTKGVANEVATKLLKEGVVEQVRGSGLFSRVDDKPVEGGALLSVTLNNVPLTDDAFAKGFMTGLTFGLAGSQVSDGYVLTLNYSKPQAPALTKLARHAIHTTMGASAAPGNAKKVSGFEEAAKTMTREVLSQGLKQLADEAAFHQ